MTSPWIEQTKLQARRIAAVLVATCSVGCASAASDAPSTPAVVAGADYREPSSSISFSNLASSPFSNPM